MSKLDKGYLKMLQTEFVDHPPINSVGKDD
jgi:hypothetical protein